MASAPGKTSNEFPALRQCKTLAAIFFKLLYFKFGRLNKRSTKSIDLTKKSINIADKYFFGSTVVFYFSFVLGELLVKSLGHNKIGWAINNILTSNNLKRNASTNRKI